MLADSFLISIIELQERIIKMENLKELQKKIKILSNISTVISLVVVVFALLGLLVMKDSPLAFVCPALVIVELSILFYIRKKC